MTDTQLQLDVVDELLYEPSVDVSEIAVTVKDGIVTLAGAVRSHAEKWSAVHAAERVLGVMAVVDDLQIKLQDKDKRSDEEIAQGVLNLLKWDVMVPDERIVVKVEHGRVTLEGTVDYKHQQVAAETAIRNLVGVKGVDNLIEVKPLITPSGVKTIIENALRRTAELDAQRIAVDVSGDKVILHGTVRTLAQRDDAKRAAWSVPGILQVEDDLKIAA
jgi:osmotically-inducible protein OsmY